MIEKGSAAKRYRQSEKRRLRNKAVRSRVRTTIRKFREAVAANDKSEAELQFKAVTKLIDTAAGKGVYHKNTAARTKSRLSKHLQQL
ncbi:MAG: 30S ribosomal protein S20 [Alkalispirochaetaceae bacterium]